MALKSSRRTSLKDKLDKVVEKKVETKKKEVKEVKKVVVKKKK